MAKKEMKPVIMDGKSLSQKIKDELKEKIKGLKIKPGLAVVLVGDNPASVLYTDLKVRACNEVGIYSKRYELSEDISESELLILIKKLNKDNQIHGILVQLPLPEHINEMSIVSEVDPLKDVDGFHPLNIGRLFSGEPYLSACTAIGVMKLIDEYKIDLAGKDVCIIGCSNIVGKPLIALCLNRRATVSVCHNKTRELKEHTKQADVVISATGVPELIKADMIKDGAVVIDVGTTKVNGILKGDIDYDKVRPKCSYITPVPGGVGPMTIACLMENTYVAYINITEMKCP
jgi:methylenetetrahydrofolate dehydrogenase (NADP+) / methenyltetrahydrofolate cyclohydrolase